MASDPSADGSGAAGHPPTEEVLGTSPPSSPSVPFLVSDARGSSAAGCGVMPAAPPPGDRRDAAGSEAEQPASKGKCAAGGTEGGEEVAYWGASSMVGRSRKEMEDAIAVVPDLLDGTCVGGCPAPSHVRFFGVYDGHGGSEPPMIEFHESILHRRIEVADYCARRIHKAVAEEWQRGHDGEGGSWQRRWKEAFSDAFRKVDDEVVSDAASSGAVGSTAVAVVLSGRHIISANCGDSRAMLCRRGDQVIRLTTDHKPDREDERARIEAGGGRVINWKEPRVLGILATSRSIGCGLLKPWVIPVPELSFTARTEEDECIVLASKGLWNALSDEEVGATACHLLRRQRQIGVAEGMRSLPPPRAAADHLVNLAFQRNASSDDITVIVVDLKSRSSRHA